MGKNFWVNIRNPIKYNTGNFTKSNNEIRDFDFLIKAICNRFIVRIKLITDQLAPTMTPQPKSHFFTKILKMHIKKTKTKVSFTDLCNKASILSRLFTYL